MNTKGLKRIILAGYFILILFFMFLGFRRTTRFDSFRFSFRITGIPLWIPKKKFSWDILQIWIFAMGNLVAFIPFGVLIPLNFQKTQKLFLKSLLTFLISITALEILQMLSLLGSFDVEDILVNTFGFLIGYISWKFSRRGHPLFNQIARGWRFARRPLSLHRGAISSPLLPGHGRAFPLLLQA